VASKINGLELVNVTYAEKEFVESVLINLKENPLTDIESQVCSLLFLGKTAKEIAVERRCSHRTIERHIDNIKAKVGDHKLSPLILLSITSSLRD
jgi:DNA-binding NarL/FixJ family response regulator